MAINHPAHLLAQVAARLKTDLPSFGSSSNICAKCVFSSVTKGASFSCRTPTSATLGAIRTDTCLAHLYGIQVLPTGCILSVNLHPTSLPNAFHENLKLQHQMLRQQTYKDYI